MKPGFEAIVLARKPLDCTVAANVQQHGTGALNVDGCRVAGGSPSVEWRKRAATTGRIPGGAEGERASSSNARGKIRNRSSVEVYSKERPGELLGRWPPNVLLTHGACCGEECGPCCPVAEMDEQSGDRQSGDRQSGEYEAMGYHGNGRKPMPAVIGDSGGASRFFPRFRYVAKASTSERNILDDQNHHPTVKPIELMRWLCKLVTPPKGTVLDPFCGSGTTGIAALRDGFSFIGIEREADYIELAERRINGDSPLFNSIGRSDTA